MAANHMLFRNNSTGDTWFEELSNGAFKSWHQVGGSNTSYALVGMGNFDGNDATDILFRNNSTGDTWIETTANRAAEQSAGAQAVAEPAEPRAGTRGNAGQQSTCRTQSRVSVSQALERIRKVAKERKKERFTALFHHISIELLDEAFYELKEDAAPGVDRLTWKDYEANLERNIEDLHDRVQRGAYRALPSRRVYIPKPDGRQRLPRHLVRVPAWARHVRCAGCALSRLEDFSAKVTHGLDGLDWPGMREIIHAVVRRIEIDRDSIEVVFRVPPKGGPSRGGGESYRQGILQDCTNAQARNRGGTLRRCRIRRVPRALWGFERRTCRVRGSARREVD
jgi:hypothetical protein